MDLHTEPVLLQQGEEGLLRQRARVSAPCELTCRMLRNLSGIRIARISHSGENRRAS